MLDATCRKAPRSNDSPGFQRNWTEIRAPLHSSEWPWHTLTQYDTDVNGPDDLAAVDALVVEFAVSRSTLFRLVTDAGLARYKRRGDRKTYLSRSAVADALGFRRVP